MTAFTCLAIDRVESKMTPNSLTLSTIAKLASPIFRLVSVERLTSCCRVPNAIASFLLALSSSPLIRNQRVTEMSRDSNHRLHDLLSMLELRSSVTLSVAVYIIVASLGSGRLIFGFSEASDLGTKIQMLKIFIESMPNWRLLQRYRLKSEERRLVPNEGYI